MKMVIVSFDDDKVSNIFVSNQMQSKIFCKLRSILRSNHLYIFFRVIDLKPQKILSQLLTGFNVKIHFWRKVFSYFKQFIFKKRSQRESGWAVVSSTTPTFTAAACLFPNLLLCCVSRSSTVIQFYSSLARIFSLNLQNRLIEIIVWQLCSLN